VGDEILDVYIGYDAREDVAYEVCSYSIRRHSSMPVHIVPLKQDALRRMGLYRRAPHPDTHVDSFDDKPFSTEFTFTRFLVPVLNQWDGWALFCDCDFLFTADIAELFALAKPNKAVMVVQHEHRPPDKTKMDGTEQTVYERKNWSSLILWNCGHPSNRKLTVDAVNIESGSWLHGFKWLEPWEIGVLPEGWNWLEGWNRPSDPPPEAIHYTRGGPWFDDWKDVDYAELWTRELQLKATSA